MPGPNSQPKGFTRGGSLIIGKTAMKRVGVTSGENDKGRENPISKPSRTPERQAIVDKRRTSARIKKAGKKTA